MSQDLLKEMGVQRWRLRTHASAATTSPHEKDDKHGEDDTLELNADDVDLSEYYPDISLGVTEHDNNQERIDTESARKKSETSIIAQDEHKSSKAPPQDSSQRPAPPVIRSLPTASSPSTDGVEQASQNIQLADKSLEPKQESLQPNQESPQPKQQSPQPNQESPQPDQQRPQQISQIRSAPTASQVSPTADPLQNANWQTLQAMLDSAELCPTCSVSNSILGQGDPRARWMFVFDAPSRNDLQQNQLCSGRAGKLFESMLHALNLDRQQVYISSVFKCAPTDDLALNPACHTMLRRQIELVQPAVVITMGEFASQSVLKANESLDQLRLSVQRCFSTQVAVVPTFSPTQMLEDTQLKAQAWSDLKVAITLLQQAAG